MNPDAQSLWRAPQWAFSILLALLGMLGPFSIDTYIPAFAGINTVSCQEVRDYPAELIAQRPDVPICAPFGGNRSAVDGPV